MDENNSFFIFSFYFKFERKFLIHHFIFNDPILFYIPTISSWSTAFMVTGYIFLIIIIRYFIAAGIFFYVFQVKGKEKWKTKKVSDKAYGTHQHRKEIKWSIVASSIFAVAGTFIIYAWQQGFTAIYLEYSWADLIYAPLSIGVVMFLHETYYYWMHKWMHHPALFKHVHKVHHNSMVASPWTSFSFHPFEAIIEAIILPLIILIIPLHPVTILFYLILMTISSVINHLDIEIYPKKFLHHFLGKWIIGATHHSLHHIDFKVNYGLYFTCWDKWMHTEHKQFNEIFERKSEAKPMKSIS